MEALRATAVPLPGKVILHGKVPSVNPYKNKGMTEGTLLCLINLAGELRYFQRAAFSYVSATL